MILGGIVASIYGIEERARHKKDEEDVQSRIDRKIGEYREGKLPLSQILKMLVLGVPKEKPTLLSRIRSFFRKR